MKNRTREREDGPRVVYLARGDDPAEPGGVAGYVLENDLTNPLTVLHVYADEADIPPRMGQHLEEVAHLDSQQRIHVLAAACGFRPGLIALPTSKRDVPLHARSTGAPSDRSPHRLDAMGGARPIP